MKLLQDVLQGIRILRKKGSCPGAVDLFWCWLGLQVFVRTRTSEGHSFRLSGLTLKSPTRPDLIELFDDIFLAQSYNVALPRRPRIIDCGANIGGATMFFKLLAPEARITCYEPSPLAFPYLKQNVEDSLFQDIVLVQAACGKHDTPIVLYVDPDHSTGSTTKDVWPGELTKFEVRQLRLSDTITEEVDLLKIDVEGAEWDILEDLRESGTLSKVHRIIIEFHHNLRPNQSAMAGFLQILEDEGFAYTMEASRSQNERFSTSWQGIVLYAWQARIGVNNG
jgi:FkbM family methyltransferase